MGLRARVAVWAVTAVALASQTVAEPFLSALQPCPQACSEHSNAEDWTFYSETLRLKACNQSMLLKFNVDSDYVEAIRACTTGATALPDGDLPTRSESDSSCAAGSGIESSVSAESGWWGSVVSGKEQQNILHAAQQIQTYINNPSHCDTTILFGYSGGAVVGLYAGAKIRNPSVSSGLLKQFVDSVQTDGIHHTQLLQLAGQNAEYTVGIFAATNGSIAHVQSALRNWNNGQQLTNFDDSKQVPSSVVANMELVPTLQTNSTLNGTLPSTNASQTGLLSRQLYARADCTNTQVISGDSCASLAKKCGISGADFTKYNPATDLCSSLMPGQHVCCSAGTLPDFAPKPNPDGSCSAYLVKDGDTCSGLAGQYSLTVVKIEKMNNETWGWAGCRRLMKGVNMCLSEGKPPMPAPLSNAICGPQVPGTTAPTNGTKLADLNQCPLNACCNIWGQCGINLDFCEPSKADSGAPGTAQPGKNGCVSNCYNAITNNKSPPASYAKIGYFEAWNFDRPCLHMDVRSIDKSYTHVHFSFANINEATWSVDVSKTKDQFDKFKAIGAKKILSFGGWSFSTDLATFPIFRQGVTAANRITFAKNVVKFAIDNGLDGLDFDWEYPGAPDIPGIPAGSPDDGKNYLDFLKLVRQALPKDKTLSIAAPASYWYLKGFPIKDMSSILDYIIYMTYDLHGQWDYGGKYSSTGCPEGDCLRSHVNLTETIDALAMITKAGVPASKIMVGISSYGRSFKMKDKGCIDPMCRYLGPDSKAKKGECTATAGYISNAEIKGIIEDNPGKVQLWRDDSLSNVLIYEDTEWVSYMDDDTRRLRTELYKGYNFGGTTDWAVDLLDFATGGENSTDPNDDTSIPWFDIPSCPAAYKTLDEIEANKGSIPNFCMDPYIVGALGSMLEQSLIKYDDLLGDGYDKSFKTYADYVKETSPESLRNFLLNKENNYFDCITEEWTGDKFQNTSKHTCPGENPKAFNIFYIPKDINKFTEDLAKDTGIEADWWSLSTWQFAPCIPSQKDCSVYGNFKNYPQLKDFEVSNPKEYISGMKSKLYNTVDSLWDYNMLMRFSLYDGNHHDVVDGSNVMVFMVQSSVESMKKIKEMGDKIDKEKKKALALLILSILLMIIPGIGEAMGPALAGVGRIITLVAEGAQAALDIYGMVKDKDSAPLAIFGILLGGVEIMSAAKSFKTAADARALLKAGDLAKLGETVKNGVGKVDSLSKACKRL